jgi:xanthine dehydrogenase YagT iron-sulfur-binding subunit
MKDADGDNCPGSGSNPQSGDDIAAVSRREFIAISTAAGATVFLSSNMDSAFAQTPSSSEGDIAARFIVNGETRELMIDPRASLLDVLRERMALTGAKKGCDHGQCGACTVHIEGRRVASCLTMAVQAARRPITTIEGITPRDGSLHPMQQAFVDHDALQCGYCTPGQIMAAIACVNEGHAASPEQIREYMSGNLCRCGAYVGIVAAIQDAAPKMRRT